MYVDERKPEYRRKIIEFLEKNGYRLQKDEFRGREEIIEAVFPIAVNEETKEYRMMGNVTCAAAAGASGCLKTREEFYSIMEKERGKHHGMWNSVKMQ